MKTHDQLYWNATGNAWTFPIDTRHRHRHAPPGATPQNLVAYTGAQGSRATNYSTRIVDDTAHFETTRRLREHQGLTIVVEWPKGFTQPPGLEARGMSLMSDNQGLTLAAICLVLLFIYYVAMWYAVGRDPKRGTIIPLYEPPDKFSPAGVRFLVRMGFDDKAFTAAILNLAVKGKITIRDEGRKQYVLTRT